MQRHAPDGICGRCSREWERLLKTRAARSTGEFGLLAVPVLAEGEVEIIRAVRDACDGETVVVLDIDRDLPSAIELLKNGNSI